MGHRQRVFVTGSGEPRLGTAAVLLDFAHAENARFYAKNKKNFVFWTAFCYNGFAL
jgi:hypothetical protein